MMCKKLPSAKRVAEMLNYDQETGVFTWRSRNRTSRFKIGDVAGWRERGYVIINFDRMTIGAHRLAWFIVHGRWPVLIDHINGIRDDNRIANLRDVDKTINGQNQRLAQSNNGHGLLGVSKIKRSATKPFVAQIRFGGKLHHLGVFETAEMAHAAYLVAKRQHHQGCTI